MRGFCSDERPGESKRRNRNVHVDEVEATLGNILDHFSLIGPFPSLTTNQAVRINGLAELYVVFLFFPIFTVATLTRTHALRTQGETNERGTTPSLSLQIAYSIPLDL